MLTSPDRRSPRHKGICIPQPTVDGSAALSHSASQRRSLGRSLLSDQLLVGKSPLAGARSTSPPGALAAEGCPAVVMPSAAVLEAAGPAVRRLPPAYWGQPAIHKIKVGFHALQLQGEAGAARQLL